MNIDQRPTFNPPSFRSWCEGYVDTSVGSLLEFYMNYDTYHLSPDEVDNPTSLTPYKDLYQTPLYEGDVLVDPSSKDVYPALYTLKFFDQDLVNKKLGLDTINKESDPNFNPKLISQRCSELELVGHRFEEPICINRQVKTYFKKRFYPNSKPTEDY